MSKPVPAGWDGHRVFVRVYGREPSAERLRRMKALRRNYEQEEDREALWQRRERLEETILPSLSRKVEKVEAMIRQASREIARRDEDEGGWTAARLEGTEYEPLLAERNRAQEKHARAVAELSVLSAYLDRPAEPEVVNPFENTTEAWRSAQAVLEAFHVGTESGRPMKRMKDLWREVGTDSRRVEKNVRDLFERAGISAGNGYEAGNVQSFVSAVQRLVDKYDEDR